MTRFTKEHKEKISRALKGRAHPWHIKDRVQRTCPCGKMFSLTPGQIRDKHGKYCSRGCYYEYRENFRVSDLSVELKGTPLHWNFKASAGYKALHLRVSRIRGKASICENNPTHISSRYEWASLTKHYEDVMDYKSLCKKCHSEFDKVGTKAWITRRKTSFEASLNSQGLTEGGDLART